MTKGARKIERLLSRPPTIQHLLHINKYLFRNAVFFFVIDDKFQHAGCYQGIDRALCVWKMSRSKEKVVEIEEHVQTVRRVRQVAAVQAVGQMHQ